MFIIVLRILLKNVVSLRRKLSQLEKRFTCAVCLDKEVKRVFLPCKHLVCCSDCADFLSRCPYCREKIIAEVTVYI